MAIRFDLHAAGVLAPGIGSLPELFACRRSGQWHSDVSAPLPSPAALPANERRRASQVVRLALACAEQALQASPFPAESLRLVFAADEGTGEVCTQMLEALATTRMVSPLLFHNSVHNAPAGYFSIGHQNRQPATSLSLGRESFAAGLLCAASEAHATAEPVLLVVYDSPMAEPLRSLLPIGVPTASAWVIASADARASGRHSLAAFEIAMRPTSAPDQAAMEEPVPPPWLPADWAANGSALGLVALALIDDPAERPFLDLPLGAQVVRLTRLSAPPTC